MQISRQAFKKTAISRAVVTVLYGTLALTAHQAIAQTDSPALNRVTVTGSNIKRTDTETASPVTVLTREDIEKTGKQSIQEVLRGITADGQGSIPTSFSAGFASGSAAVSLRGLGVNSTLVLVNGRRMTTYGLADDGTRNFVDLNSLPLEAVDRIEVLKDGGSAIYGADAVGGVVNVILRRSYVGKSIGASYGQPTGGGGQSGRVYGSLGFGDLDADGHNVFMTLETSKTKNIRATQRGFIGQSDLTAYGFYDTTNGAGRPYIGTDLPSINSIYGVIRDAPPPGSGPRTNLMACPGAVLPNGFCGYNPLVEQEVQPQIQRTNFFSRGTVNINANTTGYAEFGYFNSKTKANGTLGANNDSGVYLPGDPLNPLVFHDPMLLPAGHPDNPDGIDHSLGIRPLELGGRDQVTDNSVFRLIAGLQGSAYGWDYDMGAGWIKSRLKNTNTGYILYDEMQAAINNGTYRLNMPNTTDPAVLAKISPTLTNTPTSSVKLLDFKASRDLMKLDGGNMALALGGELRWENANTPPVPYTDTAQVVGLGYSAFTAKRRVGAIFGEVNAPITKWLELNGALRWDHYSDFGDSTTPKAGFKLKPVDWFAMRGTYAEAFRAPGPAERGGSSFGFTTVGILSQGDPSIKPETAKSYTLGFILEPKAGTSATIDFWKIKRKNEIVQADPAAILVGSSPTSTPLDVVPGAQPGSFIYYDIDGNIGTVTGFYRNAAATNTNGFDVEARHKMDLGFGKLTAQVNWTHVNKFNRTDSNGNTLEYAGTHGPIALSSGSGTPKDRASFSLTLDKGPWTFTGMANYVGAIKMIDHKGEMAVDQLDGTVVDESNGLIWNYDGSSSLNCGVYTLAGKPFNGNCKLPSFVTYDFYAKWTPMKNLDINFSVQNVFNKRAPLDPYLVLSYGSNYNQGWHQSGAVGRLMTVGAKYAF